MNKALCFIFIIFLGCSSNRKTQLLGDVGSVGRTKQKSSLVEIKIKEESAIQKNKDIVLHLSDLTTLCLPEFHPILGSKVYFTMIKMVYIHNYLKNEKLEWGRYILRKKYLKNKTFFDFPELHLSKPEVLEKIIDFPAGSLEHSPLEVKLRSFHLNKETLKGLKTLNKNNVIIISDIDLRNRVADFIKISALNKNNSVKSIKNQCSLIRLELEKVLINRNI